MKNSEKLPAGIKTKLWGDYTKYRAATKDPLSFENYIKSLSK